MTNLPPVQELSDEKLAALLDAADKVLPPLPAPRCTFADHSYPAFTASQMYEYAKTVNDALVTELQHSRAAEEAGDWLSRFTATNCNHAALDSAVGVLRTGLADKSKGGNYQTSLWAAIVDYVERASPGVRVKVRPLVWETYGPLRWRSMSSVGKYMIDTANSHRWAVFLNGDPLTGRWATADNAKAAAQMHYDALILSAIEVQP